MPSLGAALPIGALEDSGGTATSFAPVAAVVLGAIHLVSVLLFTSAALRKPLGLPLLYTA
jgi:hypothetical protein